MENIIDEKIDNQPPMIDSEDNSFVYIWDNAAATDLVQLEFQPCSFLSSDPDEQIVIHFSHAVDRVKIY